jgi:hypothetical protein
MVARLAGELAALVGASDLRGALATYRAIGAALGAEAGAAMLGSAVEPSSVAPASGERIIRPGVVARRVGRA